MVKPTIGGPGSNQYATKPRRPDIDQVAAAYTTTGDGLPDPLDDPPSPTLQRTLDSAALQPTVARFAAAGVPLHLVGGPVRDSVAGLQPTDLDLCTPAPPGQIRQLVGGLGTVVDTGAAFGTIMLHQRGHEPIEITQFRGEAYTPGSRKPAVTATDDLLEDLRRRDFTVNAMAADTTTGTVTDPFGGMADLAAGRLRTPGDPDATFDEDPLRICRMVRFAATRGWTPDDATAAAAAAKTDRLAIVSAERIQTETAKTLASPDPQALARLLDVSGTVGCRDRMLAGLDTTALDGASLDRIGPDDRLAALVWAHGDPADATSRLAAAKWPKADVAHATAVAKAIERMHTARTDLDARRAIRQTPPVVADAALRLGRNLHRPATHQVRAANDDATRWRAPLPVDGRDALKQGLRGPQVGEWLAAAETAYLTGS
jgi:tRNA nucleotidyltransferase/poly(A) polymerase